MGTNGNEKTKLKLHKTLADTAENKPVRGPGKKLPKVTVPVPSVRSSTWNSHKELRRAAVLVLPIHDIHQREPWRGSRSRRCWPRQCCSRPSFRPLLRSLRHRCPSGAASSCPRRPGTRLPFLDRDTHQRSPAVARYFGISRALHSKEKNLTG